MEKRKCYNCQYCRIKVKTKPCAVCTNLNEEPTVEPFRNHFCDSWTERPVEEIYEEYLQEVDKNIGLKSRLEELKTEYKACRIENNYFWRGIRYALDVMNGESVRN